MVAPTPAGRFGMPADIAAAVSFLPRVDASFIHATTFSVN